MDQSLPLTHRSVVEKLTEVMGHEPRVTAHNRMFLALDARLEDWKAVTADLSQPDVRAELKGAEDYISSLEEQVGDLECERADLDRAIRNALKVINQADASGRYVNHAAIRAHLEGE